jgi:hypothetical protein
MSRCSEATTKALEAVPRAIRAIPGGPTEGSLDLIPFEGWSVIPFEGWSVVVCGPWTTPHCHNGNPPMRAGAWARRSHDAFGRTFPTRRAWFRA